MWTRQHARVRSSAHGAHRHATRTSVARSKATAACARAVAAAGPPLPPRRRWCWSSWPAFLRRIRYAPCRRASVRLKQTRRVAPGCVESVARPNPNGIAARALQVSLQQPPSQPNRRSRGRALAPATRHSVLTRVQRCARQRPFLAMRVVCAPAVCESMEAAPPESSPMRDAPGGAPWAMAEYLWNATELVRVALVIALVCAVQRLTKVPPSYSSRLSSATRCRTHLFNRISPPLGFTCRMHAVRMEAVRRRAVLGKAQCQSKLASSWHRRFARWQAARSLSALGTQPACVIAFA